MLMESFDLLIIYIEYYSNFGMSFHNLLSFVKNFFKILFWIIMRVFFFGGVCGEINTKSYKRNNLISLIIFPKMDITTLHVDNTVKSCLALLQEILPFG